MTRALICSALMAAELHKDHGYTVVGDQRLHGPLGAFLRATKPSRHLEGRKERFFFLP
jgi:hypothetical protein